jgi:hypothetical protein
LVMLVPRRLTNWPAHMTVKPVMPLSLEVKIASSGFEPGPTFLRKEIQWLDWLGAPVLFPMFGG